MTTQKLLLVARFRSLHPVNTLKHVVDSDGNVGTTQAVVDVITAAENAQSTVSNEVDIGATVNAIYLRLEALHTAGVGRPNFYMYVMKNPGNNVVNPTADAVGVSDERRFVIHQSMVMLSGDAGNGLPRVVFDGVIRIPRGYKRFGIKDRLQVVVKSGATSGNDWCLQCIYKEIR